jgi:hypothetical protein
MTLISMTITFEDALQKTQELLAKIESLDAAEITQQIAELVATENGTRGFFVTYLTSDYAWTATPKPEVIKALKTSLTVDEVLVKTLAMSTAMAITHRNNGDEENAQGSEKVQQKTSQLIKRLLSPVLTEKLQQLSISLHSSEGQYQAFLDRWEYDHWQRQAIAEIIQPFLH